MPCDSLTREQAQQLARERQLKALEKALKNKSARIARVGNSVDIEGWDERGGWCDECAIRSLRQSEDFEVRHLVATAVPTETGIKFGHGH